MFDCFQVDCWRLKVKDKWNIGGWGKEPSIFLLILRFHTKLKTFSRKFIFSWTTILAFHPNMDLISSFQSVYDGHTVKTDFGTIGIWYSYHTGSVRWYITLENKKWICLSSAAVLLF